MDNQPPLTNPEIVSQTSKLRAKNLAFLPIILAFVLIISLGLNALLYLGFIDNTRGIHKYLPSWTKIPEVKDYGFYYYIETTLVELRNVAGANEPGDIEVITHIQGPGLPRFFLGEDTDVFIVEDNTFKKVGRDQLKPGQRIGILFNYYRLEQWGLPRITILP